MPPDWPSTLSLHPLLLPSVHFPSLASHSLVLWLGVLWRSEKILQSSDLFAGPRFGSRCVCTNSKPTVSKHWRGGWGLKSFLDIPFRWKRVGGHCVMRCRLLRGRAVIALSILKGQYDHKYMHVLRCNRRSTPHRTESVSLFSPVWPI